MLKPAAWVQRLVYQAVRAVIAVLALWWISQTAFEQIKTHISRSRLDYDFSEKTFRLHGDIIPNTRQPAHDAHSVKDLAPYNRVFHSYDPPSRFHLLVSSANADTNLCKLLLSVAALGYPSPTFINLGIEAHVAAQERLRRSIEKVVEYLTNLVDKPGDDLVLIVDGSSVLFQLPPETIILRYYEIIATENDRLLKRSQTGSLEAHNIYSSIVFGPDKVCFPAKPEKPACWAVPESPLPPFAFGPDTDGSGKWPDHNKPRWLGAGTVLGPASDLSKLYIQLLERMSGDDVPLGQASLADMFGEQEIARSKYRTDQRNGSFPAGANAAEGLEREFPKFEPGHDSEYHITLDYESSIFQALSFYWKYLGWFAHDAEEHLGVPATGDEATHHSMTYAEEMHFQFPEDLLNSSPPPLWEYRTGAIAPLRKRDGDPSRDPHPVGMRIPPRLDWRDLILGTNTITRRAFAMINFTPPREYIDRWWDKMWYFPYGEAIIRNARRSTERLLVTTADGRQWHNRPAAPAAAGGSDGVSESDTAEGAQAVGGLVDQHWRSWPEMCREHEDVIFRNALP